MVKLKTLGNVPGGLATNGLNGNQPRANSFSGVMSSYFHDSCKPIKDHSTSHMLERKYEHGRKRKTKRDDLLVSRITSPFLRNFRLPDWRKLLGYEVGSSSSLCSWVKPLPLAFWFQNPSHFLNCLLGNTAYP